MCYISIMAELWRPSNIRTQTATQRHRPSIVAAVAKFIRTNSARWKIEFSNCGRTEIILLTDNIQMNVMRHVRGRRNLKQNMVKKNQREGEREREICAENEKKYINDGEFIFKFGQRYIYLYVYLCISLALRQTRSAACATQFSTENHCWWN